jgi:mannose-6-phosphate isomerase
MPGGAAVDLLDNPVQPYAWGSETAIPELLGVPPSGEPQAELWMGTHPDGPSRLRSGGTLLERVEADPAGELGPAVLERFGPRLPFLLKVLGAARNLSLQTHPDLDRARAGFAEEEARGVPADAPERNYVDANHKPELVCALGEFEALCGFRAIPDTLRLLDPLTAAVPELRPYVATLRDRRDRAGLCETVDRVLTVPEDRRRDLVAAVAAACAARLAPGFDAELRTVAELAEAYPGDLGVVIALLLNRVELAPGEALFLAAGNLHCYLRGTAIELQANSNNVLRGGLTGKHVDVPELLRVLDVADGPPPRLRPVPAGPGRLAYVPPVPDFRLDKVTLGDTTVESDGPQILLTVAGTALVDGAVLERGASAWVPAGRAVRVRGSGELVRATTNL